MVIMLSKSEVVAQVCVEREACFEVASNLKLN